MTPRPYPCIINIIRDLVNSIEDRSGIDLPSPGFDPAEKFAIESFLIGVLDRYGKVKCNSGTSDQSNSNGVDLPSPNTPPSTPVATPFKSSLKESRSTTIDLDTAQTSPASGANSTPAASRDSGAKSKRARAEASRSSSPSGSDGRQNMYPRNPYPVPAPLPPNSEGAAQSATNTSHTRMFSLQVEQQPIRARMCGFGDKDRRPITPPPCIRLIVCDASTGKEVDFTEVNSTFFVLTVDLWDANGTHEVNLVRYLSGVPTVSISSSTITSYPPPDRPPMCITQMSMQTYRDPYGQPVPNPQPQGNLYSAPPPIPPSYYSPTPNTPITPARFQFSLAPNVTGTYVPITTAMPLSPPPATATRMFTRNLIGSLTVNAFRLTDTEGKVGFWFILQDLSVRTEGNFRLKMNFINVGSGQGNNTLNTDRAPVLATCFSEQFQVYSAKKFPGVIESTLLSKVFASQGIKIPIRKDGPNGPKTLSNQAEYDAND